MGLGNMEWIKNQIKELENEYEATTDTERLRFIDGKLCILKLWLEDKRQSNKFDCEFLLLDSLVKGAIKECEGKHIQQIAYSSYHDALTQICFGCRRIRTSVNENDVKAEENKQ